jgi:hypothetical protein
MPRSPVSQLTKFQAKYDADNMRVALSAVRDSVMIPRFQAAVSAIASDREIVRSIIAAHNVPPGLQGVHYAFGFAVSSAKFSHSGPVLATVVQALKYRFAALGGIPTVLDDIAEALTGFRPAY